MDQDIIDLVNEKNDLQIAIRCHLVVEHFLIKVIEECLLDKNEFNVDKLSFRQKVELALSLGEIEKDMKGILLSVNKLRNQYAHDMNKKVSEKEINEMYSSLNPICRKALACTNYENQDTLGKLGGIFLMLYSYLTSKLGHKRNVA